MVKVSFLEKMKQLFSMITNNNYSIIVIGILFILLLIILFACKKNDKLIKIMFVSLYIMVITGLIYRYHVEIVTLYDYLVENIVANLLFPNLAIYMGVLLFLNIIVLWSIFSNKVKFYVKSINIVCFALMQLFLYLIINNVIANNVNVYEKLSIYTNQNLLILVELSMQLFVVWICVLGIIKLIDYFMGKSITITENNNMQLVIENNEVQEINDYNVMDSFIEYVPIKKVKKLD